jgi:hypothetical protein
MVFSQSDFMGKARRENSTKKMSDLTHKNCIIESNKTT